MQSETAATGVMPSEQETALAVAAVAGHAAPSGAFAAGIGHALPRGMASAQRRVLLALQRGAGNAAVTRMLQQPADRAATASTGLCECGGVAESGGVCASCAGHDDGGAPPRAAVGRSMSRRVLARDAAAKQQISDAIKANKPTAPGGADPGYEEAFRILNGLAMFDMLSTLTALRRAGLFDDLSNHFKSAIGVHLARLQLAFDAVRGKGTVQADGFAMAHAGVMGALPVDQRQDIINYLDPNWLDEMKAAEDAEPLITAIRATAAYRALAPAAKALADEIITEAKKTPGKVVYYLTKLKLLFDTPMKTPDQITTETSASTGAAATAERKRIAQPAAAKNAGREERASRARNKKSWVPVVGKFGGGTYYVDASDPTDIVVKASILLKPIPTAVGDAAAITSMEDAIEKAASTQGYTVDLTFVKRAVAGCFTVDVHPGGWAVATNWAGGSPSTFAHELHHMFTYELDKYDYIESHADNDSMEIPDRLTWFRTEMSKPAGWNDPTSIINSGDNHPNDEDVCRVAGLDLAKCIAARQRKRAAAP